MELPFVPDVIQELAQTRRERLMRLRRRQGENGGRKAASAEGETHRPRTIVLPPDGHTEPLVADSPKGPRREVARREQARHN